MSGTDRDTPSVHPVPSPRVTGNINPRNHHDWAQLRAQTQLRALNVLSKTSVSVYPKAKDIRENVGDNEALSSVGDILTILAQIPKIPPLIQRDEHQSNNKSKPRTNTSRANIRVANIVIFCK